MFDGRALTWMARRRADASIWPPSPDPLQPCVLPLNVKTSTSSVELSMYHMVLASVDHARPLLMVTPPRALTGCADHPSSTQSDAPPAIGAACGPSGPVLATDPTQRRPCGSAFPSFMRSNSPRNPLAECGTKACVLKSYSAMPSVVPTTTTSPSLAPVSTAASEGESEADEDASTGTMVLTWRVCVDRSSSSREPALGS
mmetsp:Transcript_37632/g.99452  ORF Transcript_37632/g.99452 Transcript_37632/m.99452 type:complete len:200 (+) Transcript_37632:555-1154(+)